MRYARYIFIASIVWASSIYIAPGVSALSVPPTPTASPIVDNAQILSPDDETALAKRILDGQAVTGNQIAILTIKSLEGSPIEEYSIAVARAWGIGGKERDNGVLLLVAVNDRKVRIEVGYGLEGALTDIRSGQIIRERISPAFRNQQYAQGISAGLDSVLIAIRNEKDPNLGPSENTRPSTSGPPIELILYALFLIPAWLGSILARTKSWWAGGVIGVVIGGIIAVFFGFMLIGLLSIIGLFLFGLGLDYAVSRNYHRRTENGITPSWWAGGTHLGGGPSGGFGGFGGGGFGGGGASGDW